VLRFQAGPAEAPQALELRLDTQALVCVEPQVEEAVFDPPGNRVLFRDGFGIYAVAEGAPQPLVFLPAVSRTFLRAFGTDAGGALWLWTLDRTSGEHVVWRRDGDLLEALLGSYDGAEALRLWDERTVSLPFQSLGARSVRSSCVQRRATGERFCFERGAAGGGRAAVFRLVLGGPNRVDVLLDRCVPSGLAAAADSARVVASLFEDVDARGTSEILSLWVADFSRATRVVESLLPSPRDTRARQRNSVFWLRATELFWADAAGQLFRVDARAPAAATLVSPPARRRPSIHVVVVDTVATAAAAESLRLRLAAAALDAGVLARGDGGFEVQAGGFADAVAAAAALEAVRGAGFAAARVRSGGVDGVGLDMAWGHTPAPGGGTVYLRQSRQGERVVAEIWRRSRTGEAELLVSGFHAAAPRAVP
jgi:hypothetical protein